MVVKCFYHLADHDGKASAAIVQYHYNGIVKLFPFNYGYKFPWDQIDKNDIVYMVDISLEPKQLQRLKENCKEFYFIDHHSTTIDALKINGVQLDGLTKVGMSGCELTWKFLRKEKIPTGIKMLGRYDVWDLKYNKYVVQYEYGARSLELDPVDNMSKWKKIINNDREYDKFILDAGKHVLRYCKNIDKDRISRCSIEFRYTGYNFISVNTDTKGSLQFDDYIDPHKHDVMMVYNRTLNGWSFSLYTYKDYIDVSEIAKNFGGGGHKNAAGFASNEIPEDLKNYIY